MAHAVAYMSRVPFHTVFTFLYIILYSDTLGGQFKSAVLL